LWCCIFEETKMLIDVKESGHDLGVAARGKLAKSSEAILDLAVVIHKAYDLYYAPRAKRGRPRKGSAGIGNRLIVEWDRKESEWEAFLAASGYDMAQHSKLLRNYWRVGKKAGALRRNSENLPNSLDALAELCADGVENREFCLVLAEMTPQATADDVRFLLRASRTVPLEDVDSFGDLMADYHQSEVKHRFKEACAAQKQAANSTGLLSLPPIEVTRENMARVALLTMVARKLGFPVGTKAELQEALGEDFTQISGTLGGAYWWRKGVEDGIEKLVREKRVEPYLEAVMEAA
jgi:hypothetical protein